MEEKRKAGRIKFIKREIRELRKFSLLVFLPLILGLIVVPIVLSMTNNQLDEKGALTTKVFESEMKVVMEDVENTGENLITDERFTEFVFNESPTLAEENKLVGLIENYINENSSVNEIYVCDGIHGYIYSSQAIYLYNSYNTVITSKEISELNLPDIEVGWHMMNEDETVPYYFNKLETTQGSVYVLVMVDKDKIKDVINSINAKACAVFNDDGYVTSLYLAGKTVDWASDESVSNILGTQVKCFYSEAEGYRFVTVVSYAEYRRPFKLVLMIFIIYFAAIIIAGGIYVSVIVKRESERWNNLLEALPDNKDQDPTSWDEIMNNVKNSLITFNENKEQYDFEKRSHSVRQLIKSRVTGDYREKYEEAGIPTDAAAFCVVTIYADDYSDMLFNDSSELSNIDYSRVVFKSVLNEVSQKRAVICTTGLGKFFAAVFCFGSIDGAGKIAFDISQQTANFIESNYGLNLHVAISSIINNLSDLPAAYHETEQLQDYINLFGMDSAVVTPENLTNAVDDSTDSGYLLQLQYIESVINAEKYDYVPQLIDNILKQYVQTLGRHYYIAESRINGISCVLAEAVLYSGKKNADLLDMSNRLRDCKTVAELNETTGIVFGELSECTSKEEEDDPVSEACRYIDENYKNANLSVTDISDNIGISPQYLNRLFHKKMGIKVIAYLQRQRIKEAKRLLAQSSMSVNEIAEQCGYNNISSFMYNFKNTENTTPAAYREWAEDHKIAEQ